MFVQSASVMQGLINIWGGDTGSGRYQFPGIHWLLIYVCDEFLEQKMFRILVDIVPLDGFEYYI